MRESLGHPILGDPIYGNPKRQIVHVSRLMLHAWKLSLHHPIHNQPMNFEAPVPPEFQPWMQAIA
jgi:23S rRNA pseudouridine1911/1915/1917 synthase